MSVISAIRDWFAGAWAPTGTLDDEKDQAQVVVIGAPKPEKSPARAVTDPTLTLGNPLADLDPAIVAGFFEDALRGRLAEIQWLFEWVVRVDPYVLALNARREAALGRLTYQVRVPKDLKGADAKLAERQRAALADYYHAQDNLPAVFSHLAGAVFRGYAHVYRRYDGTLAPAPAWAFVRQGLSGTWFWNPSAQSVGYESMQATDALEAGRWLSWDRPNNLLFIALLAHLRSTWSNRWWDKFCEAVSKLGIVIVGPPGMTSAQVEGFKADAANIARGGSGVLPNGSDVRDTNATRGAAPYGARLEDLRTSLVIAATGGMLTSLAAPTGLGSGVADVQDAVFDSLVSADAAAISSLFQRIIDAEICNRETPGRPRLAFFDLARPEQEQSPEELAQLSAALAPSGYRVTMAALAEATGLDLEPLPAAPAVPSTPFVAARAAAGPVTAPAHSCADAAAAATVAAAAAPGMGEPGLALTAAAVEFASLADEPPPRVPAAWSAPLADAVFNIGDLVEAGGDIEDVLQHIDDLSKLMADMDHDALAAVLAQELSRAVARGIAAEIAAKPLVAGKLLRQVTAAADSSAAPLAFAAGAEPEVGSIQAAVEKLLGKALAPSTMGSAEWAAVPQAIRDQSFFSARVASAGLLSDMKRRLDNAVELATNEQGAFTDRSAFIRELRDLLKASGFELSEGGEGSVRDLTSPARLGLIYDTQITMATEFARHQIHQDPDVLAAYPARELLRMESRQVPRNWIERWRAAGGQLFERRMVAPVNDPIWSAISAFGNPYPPFDFNSGMGVLDLSAAEAARLGVPTSDQAPQPTAFAADKRAAISDLDRETLLALRDELRGQSTVAQGQIAWTPGGQG